MYVFFIYCNLFFIYTQHCTAALSISLLFEYKFYLFIYQIVYFIYSKVYCIVTYLLICIIINLLILIYYY